MITITRKIEFDAGHRIVQHGGKCQNLHGHRYTAEITVSHALDHMDMVTDFATVKASVGGWVDEHWDHAMILNRADTEVIALVQSMGSKHYIVDAEPTAETLVAVLGGIAEGLLAGHVCHVRLFETPNCWADWTPDAAPTR